MKNKDKFDPEKYPAITAEYLRQSCQGAVCECCGEPFSVAHPPNLAPRCHGGGVTVRHWGGMLYLSCYTCDKPIFKIWIGRRVTT